MKFILGLAVGVGLGMIFAPAPGEETRERLVREAQDLADAPRRKAEEIAADVRQKAGDKGAELGRKAAERAVDKVSESVTGTAGARRP